MRCKQKEGAVAQRHKSIVKQYGMAASDENNKLRKDMCDDELGEERGVLKSCFWYSSRVTLNEMHYTILLHENKIGVDLPYADLSLRLIRPLLRHLGRPPIILTLLA
jgi:hypothetical protein